MSVPRQGKRYTVKAGDTLQSIAATAYGNTSKWRLLTRAFGREVLSSSMMDIFPGQTIYIPVDPALRKLRNNQRR